MIQLWLHKKKLTKNKGMKISGSKPARHARRARCARWCQMGGLLLMQQSKTISVLALPRSKLGYILV